MALSVKEAEEQFEKTIEHLKEELKKLRTGRASASMLENVSVEVYGQAMPLPHVATITAVDAQLIQISPFDPNNLQAISTAIREDQSLNLNPADDGKVVRVPIPPMTTERRQEVVKQLHAKVEEANIAFRNTRHEVLQTLKQQKNDKEISEDEYNRYEKQVEELMDSYKQKADDMAATKEEEVLTV